MSNCGFCYVCDVRYCPKEGKAGPVYMRQISLSSDLFKKLQKFCENKGFMQGEEYYKVPAFNAAISFLLEEYSKKSKHGRRGE